MRVTIPLLVALLFLGACSPGEEVSSYEGNAAQQKITFSPSGLTLFVDKADTDEKRQKGLMERKDLKDKEGMIFFFPRTDRHAFWMFNTYIPLAIVFVNEDLVVVDVQSMKPCLSPHSEECPVYVSSKPSRMAIEMNQETARKYQIAVGNRITFEDR